MTAIARAVQQTAQRAARCAKKEKRLRAEKEAIVRAKLEKAQAAAAGSGRALAAELRKLEWNSAWNKPCPCGKKGLKFKLCCATEEQRAERHAQTGAQPSAAAAKQDAAEAAAAAKALATTPHRLGGGHAAQRAVPPVPMRSDAAAAAAWPRALGHRAARAPFAVSTTQASGSPQRGSPQRAAGDLRTRMILEGALQMRDTLTALESRFNCPTGDRGGYV